MRAPPPADRRSDKGDSRNGNVKGWGARTGDAANGEKTRLRRGGGLALGGEREEQAAGKCAVILSAEALDVEGLEVVGGARSGVGLQ